MSQQQIKDFFQSFLKSTVPIQAPIIIPTEIAVYKIVNNIVLYFFIPNWSIQTGIYTFVKALHTEIKKFKIEMW